MKTKYYLMVLMMLIMVLPFQAQSISYGYDATGNRTSQYSGTSDNSLAVSTFASRNVSQSTTRGIDPNGVQYDVNVGYYYDSFEYTDARSTNSLGNMYGGEQKEICYRIYLEETIRLVIDHCGSELTETSIYLLDGNGRLIASKIRSNSCGCETSTQASLDMVLNQGTYYIVSEGYNTNGSITTHIEGFFMDLQGDEMENAISTDYYSNNFSYTESFNTYAFTDKYGNNSRYDVFHELFLETGMTVTISHCGSELADTKMSLLDESGTLIESSTYSVNSCTERNRPLIRRQLPIGTYYIVSEGTTMNGGITLTITGEVNEFGYEEMPDAHSAELYPVGDAGGSFHVSPIGAAVYTIPIQAPLGVGSMQPSLSLVYNSQSGNSVAGYGCSIGGLSVITRGPKNLYHDGVARGMTYGTDDAFYMDGKRLILESGTAGIAGAVYRPESDPFTKVTVQNNGFKVEGSDGMTYYYGGTADSRQSYTNALNATHIHAWYINKVEDTMGNYMTYLYTREKNTLYLSEVAYGNNSNQSTGLNNTVSFEYESRNDSIVYRMEGIQGVMDKRLKNVVSKTGTYTFRSYLLEYDDTGDGIANPFSRLVSVTEGTGNGETLKPVQLYWNHLPEFGRTASSVNVTNASTNADSFEFSDQQFICGDFNGDGLTDIMGIAPITRTINGIGSATTYYDTYAYIYRASLNGTTPQFLTGNVFSLGANFEINGWKEQRSNYSVIDFDGDGINEFIVPRLSVNEHWKQVGFYVYNTKGYWEFGDDLQYSDEMPPYVVTDLNKDGKGEILYIEKKGSNGSYPGFIYRYTNDGSFKTSINVSLPYAPQKTLSSDWNGDGMEDLLFLYDGGYSIYWNQGGNDIASVFSETQKTSGTNMEDCLIIRMGDFNGDGLPDLIMNAENETAWYFALNNGDGTFNKVQVYTLDRSTDNDRLDCNVFDFDNDGKSDAVITMAGFPGARTYWMRSTGNGLVQVDYASSVREEDASFYRYLVGDFNGDGIQELMNYGYDCANGASADTDPSWHVYTHPDLNASAGKVQRIVDAYSNVTYVNYSSLANPNIYTKGTGGTYPMVDYTLPLQMVNNVRMSNAGMANTQTNYTYGDLKVHLQGKGLLGLGYQKVEDTTMGTTTETKVDAWNTTYFVPSKITTTTTAGSGTARSVTTYGFSDHGSKKFFAYPVTTVDTDYEGNVATTTRQYNTTLGYQTEEKTVYNSSGTMYKKVEYLNQVKAGGVYRPQTIISTQKHEDDTSVYQQTRSLTYNTTKGYTTKEVQNGLTTDYVYDSYGNRISSTISGSDITALTENYEYDATGRFVVKRTTVPASTIMTYTYDTWGNVLTETDATHSAHPLTTTHTYDAWGTRIATVHPDGTKQTATVGWATEPELRYFTLSQGTAQPWVKTWYDARGRKVRTESRGEGNVTLLELATYNKKGQVTANVVSNGDLTTSESYTYDDRGRLLTHSLSTGKSTSYAYGNRKDTVTVNNRRYIKTYDAWGNVKTSTDPVSSVSYVYSSVGKPKQAASAGATFSMTYDSQGRQTSLTDPDAGTETYEYDVLDRIVKQTDAKGKVTENDYDAFGKILSTTIDGIATTYDYDSYHRLEKETREGTSVSYTYDDYNRVKTESRTIDASNTLGFTYNYNAQGLLQSTVYPGNVTVGYAYDGYGNLASVTAGNTKVWEFASNNGLRYTATLGGTLTSVEERNSQGLLTSQRMLKGSTLLHNMGYTFNGTTGNLTSRSGMLSQTETFGYDNVDRLTSVQHGSTTAMTLTYGANGNITSKTGIGTYSYGTKPHAVTGVTNSGSLIDSNTQSITYTPFDKAASISQGNYQLDITYGTDLQRWKSVLKNNGTVTRTTLYAGDYEKVTENGVTKQYYYLHGGNGLAALYVKQSNASDKVYYPCTDHLGSIIKLVDANGTESFKATYDAWGQQTITTNTLNFHRGYTGHEHLSQFALINMNGRMYDPLLGRFLSPDPFVQLPDFSQNFNRYSYCLNNPLVYVDPNGEWFVIDDLIFGLVGGTMNLIGNLGTINNPWHALGYFGIGFTSGLVANYVTPLGAAAITGMGNAALSGYIQTGSVNLDQVITSGISSVAMAGITMGMSNFVASNVGPMFQNVSSPVLQGALTQSTVGMATGSILGGVDAVITGENFWNGFVNGGLKGFRDGFLTGAYSGYQYAKQNDLNPWTGNPAFKGDIDNKTTTTNSVSKQTESINKTISDSDYNRIENAATKIDKTINVVGSRASGTANANSDWDYIIDGINRKQWNKIKNSLPGSKSIIDNTPRRIDLIKMPLDIKRPYISIQPRKKY